MPKTYKSLTSVIESESLVHGSMRKYALAVGEHYTDLTRWKNGSKKPALRSCINLCKRYGFIPHELNPDLFPPDLRFTFLKKD